MMGIAAFVGGVVVGLIVAGIVMVYMMRRYMVVGHISRYDFDETIERLKKAVEEYPGWVFPFSEWKFSDAMKAKNYPFGTVDRLVVFYVCKGEYAQKVVDADNNMASIMPCGWAVYEKGGKTYIGTMNIGLMSKMFGGVIKDTMKKVAQEEKEMLDKVLH